MKIFSRFAILLYFLIAIGLGFWAYMIYKDRFAPVTTPNPSVQDIVKNDNESQQSSENSSIKNTLQNTDDSAMNNTTPPLDDSLMNSSFKTESTQKISPEVEITGPKLANITPEHCNNNCQAFAADLKLFEYCEQSCGISPIKNVSNCDDKKGIQKDYCKKDLAINKKDIALCKDVKDGNIRQSCENHISEAAILEMQRNRPSTEPTY